MIESITKENRPPFAHFRKPKLSLLRRTATQASRHDLPNLSLMLTASSVEIAFSFGRPLVVTSSRPQASMGTQQDSVTSLNPQGRAVTI